MKTLPAAPGTSSMAPTFAAAGVGSAARKKPNGHEGGQENGSEGGAKSSRLGGSAWAEPGPRFQDTAPLLHEESIALELL